MSGQIYDPLTLETVGGVTRFVCAGRSRAIPCGPWLVIDAVRGSTSDGTFTMIIAKGQTLRRGTVVDGSRELRTVASM